MDATSSGGISAAGRLLAMIDSLLAQPDTLKLYGAAAMSVSKEGNDQGAGYRVLGDLYELIGAAKAEVQAHPELNQSLYLPAITDVEAAVRGVEAPHPWGALKPLVKQARTGLAFCADQMNRISGELLIPGEELDEILELATRMLEEVASSDLPSDVKELLRERLEDIRRAVIEYRLHGAEALRRVVDAGVGAVVRCASRPSESGSMERVRSFLVLIVKLDLAMRAAGHWVALAAPEVAKYLPR